MGVGWGGAAEVMGWGGSFPGQNWEKIPLFPVTRQRPGPVSLLPVGQGELFCVQLPPPPPQSGSTRNTPHLSSYGGGEDGLQVPNN